MINVRRAAVAALAVGALVGGASGATAATSTKQDTQVCGLDVAWLKMSTEGDYFEIQGGWLALHKANSKSVEKLARTLVVDHKKSLADNKAVAAKYGIELPDGPSPTQMWELEELREMGRQEFEHDYAELEVKDHIQDIDESQDEVKMGCNDAIQALAKDEIPTLEYHLTLSKRAYRANRDER
jgi:predicted outer membrane protein